jgi:hypothetical protein
MALVLKNLNNLLGENNPKVVIYNKVDHLNKCDEITLKFLKYDSFYKVELIKIDLKIDLYREGKKPKDIYIWELEATVKVFDDDNPKETPNPEDRKLLEIYFVTSYRKNNKILYFQFQDDDKYDYEFESLLWFKL